MGKIKRIKLFLLTFMAFMLVCTPVFAEETEKAVENASHYGWFTILPSLIAIVLAFITKNVVASLFIGALSGCFMVKLTSGNVFYALIQGFLDFVQRALNALADPWNAGIILQVMVIGGVIGIVTKMGGAKAVAESLAKKAKTPRSAQIITWVLGLLVFFDDYANSLIVGPIMRPVADKLKISRARLAFIIDATAAPVAGIMFISTWIGLELGLIKDGFNMVGQNVDSFGIFLSTIPYRFYNILILVFVFMTSILLRDFGPMRKLEVKSRKRHEKILEKEAVEEVAASTTITEDQPKEGIKLSIWNAVIPIAALILSALASFYYSGYSAIIAGDNESLKTLVLTAPSSFDAIREAFSASDASVSLFQSALFASIVAIVMAVGKKILTISEAVDSWVNGMKTLAITGVILILAWSLSSVIKELGTATFLVSKLSTTVPAFILPSIIFIFGAIISFATGTAYGTMGILMPLAIPLAFSISPDMGYVIVNISAVLTGAIFGDHCSPISDTTILSSMGAGCSHIEHVSTQLPYALSVAAVTVLFGYIPAGLGLPIAIILPVDVLIIFALVYFVGKPVDYMAVENK